MRKLAALILKAAFGWFAGWIGGYLQRRKLASEIQRADKAEAQAQADEHVIAAGKIREEAEHAAQSLPDAPDQQVGKAKPGTAAAELEKGTW